MLTLARKKTTKLKGGEVIARMLQAEGVDTVFGIIDGTYFGFYGQLEPNGIRLMVPRHEACAAHMAGAYARITGKLGVCMASNGPGVANVLGGVAVEQAEGNRVLLITSHRRRGTISPDRGGTFQYFSQVDVTRPMTKWSELVPDPQRLPELVRMALRHCFTGRPGVVHLDVPEDIMNGTFSFPGDWQWEPQRYRSTAFPAPHADQLEEAVAMLLTAERPLIHAGSGVLHAQAASELERLAELLQAPVTTSWAGRGAISELHEYHLALPYLNTVKQARNEADLVLVLGSRLGETDWWGKAPYWAHPSQQQMIQVDLDPTIIGVNKPADLGIVADCKAFMALAIEALEACKADIPVASRKAWVAKLTDRATKRRLALDTKHLTDHSSPLHPAVAVHLASTILPTDTVFVLDGGNTAVWGNFFHQVPQPASLLATWKMGMLGAGVPQALGAAATGRRACCLIGDGAMGMNLQELETAVRNRLNVIFCVFCDRAWGMVKINQNFARKPLKTLVKGVLPPDECIGTDFDDIRFDQVAQAMGAHGEHVSSPATLEAALERCLAQDGPSVIHLEIDPVKHLWAPGLKQFKDMHAEPRG